MNVMLGFMLSIWKMSWYWRIWIALLMMVNGVLPFLYLQFVEAKVVLILFMIAAITQILIYQSKGFVRLLGLGHLYWLPMLVWLALRVNEGHVPETVLNWIIAVVVLNAGSLLIDMTDVIRYWRGERLPVIVLQE